jgi:hypothetical protein
MTQHTSPVLYFHTDATRRKKNLFILFTAHIHPRKYKRLFQQIHENSLKVPSASSSLSLSPILLQQKLSSPLDAAEDY